MARQLGATSLPPRPEIFWREQIVILNVNREVQSSHDRRPNIESSLDIIVHIQLLNSRFLQVADFKQFRIKVPIVLVVHLDKLLLESLLQILYFLLVLFLDLLYLVNVNITSFSLLLQFLLVCLLLLFAQ